MRRLVLLTTIAQGPTVGGAATAVVTHIVARAALCPPDVIMGYDATLETSCGAERWRQSDLFRGLCYHEYAHASHYAKTGNAYWELVQQKPTRAADIDRLLRNGYLRNY